MLKIWGRTTSSNVQKVLWCCAELGLQYERVDLGGPFGGNQDPEYLALNPNGLVPSDIDWLVPHQANTRIIDAVGRKLGLPRDKTVVTIDRHANTSAASIPLALDEAVTDGRIRPGHLVLMEALGGGLTWGASIARW